MNEQQGRAGKHRTLSSSLRGGIPPQCHKERIKAQFGGVTTVIAEVYQEVISKKRDYEAPVMQWDSLAHSSHPPTGLQWLYDKRQKQGGRGGQPGLMPRQKGTVSETSRSRQMQA